MITKGLRVHRSKEPETNLPGNRCRLACIVKVAEADPSGGISRGGGLRSVAPEKMWKSLPRGQNLPCLGKTQVSQVGHSSTNRRRNSSWPLSVDKAGESWHRYVVKCEHEEKAPSRDGDECKKCGLSWRLVLKGRWHQKKLLQMAEQKRHEDYLKFAPVYRLIDEALGHEVPVGKKLAVWKITQEFAGKAMERTRDDLLGNTLLRALKGT